MKRLISIITIIATLTLISCGPGRKLTKADYAVGTAFTIAKIGDAYTTMDGMDKGAVEQSPLLGEHPSDGTIIISSILITGLMWLILKYSGHPNMARTIVGLNAGFAGAVAMKNYNTIKKME